MSSLAAQRVQREVKEVMNSTDDSGIRLELVDNNVMKLTGIIPGPRETPYEGGTYYLEINVPAQYPFAPPKVKFTTQIWHPNISSATGAICLDTLNTKWVASMTLRIALLSIQALLSAAEPNDPQDAVVANQYKCNYELYCQTARYWAHAFAGSSKMKFPILDDAVSKVVAMGFDEKKAIVTLSNKSWVIEAAIQDLFD